jgi:hypothetical protein
MSVIRTVFSAATVKAYFTGMHGGSGADPRSTFITGTAELGMGDVVNLRRARKHVKRQLAEQRAVANRLLHGQSKSERARHTAIDEKAQRDLERHRIETGDHG